MIKFILILGIVLTLAYMVLIWFDFDRTFKIEVSTLPKLIGAYSLKPKTERRSVVLLKCSAEQEYPCEKTIKSILDQSVRVYDIAIETDRPDLVNRDLLDVVTVHKPNTASVRETEADTVVFVLVPGKEYPYDFIETEIEKLKPFSVRKAKT